MRRVALAAAVSAALVTCGLVAPDAGRAAAVTFQADAQHTGYVPTGGPALPLRRRWSVPLGRLVSYPVIAEGKAFVVTHRESGPELVALSLRTGRRVWSRFLGGEPANPHGASLAYDAGRLFVTRDSYGYPRPSAMLALAPADGRVLWETGEQLTLFDAVPPVATDGVVYLSETGGGAGGISAWRQDTGAPLWRVSTYHGGGGSVAVAGETVLTHVGCPPELFRVRRDGTPLVPTSSGCSSGGGGTPVVAGGRVLLSDRFAGAGIFDLVGNRLGDLRSDDVPATGRGVILTTDSRIPGEPFGARGRTVIARRLGGRELWRFRGDGYLDATPLIAGRTAFLGSGSGLVYAVDLHSGRVRSRIDVGGSVPMAGGSVLVSGLAAGDGVLLVPARGRLVALD